MLTKKTAKEAGKHGFTLTFFYLLDEIHFNACELCENRIEIKESKIDHVRIENSFGDFFMYMERHHSSLMNND